MAATVQGIECPANQWTRLSNAKAKVLVVVRGNGAGRIVIAPSAPAAGLPPMDYLTLTESRAVGLQFDDTANNVYVWPTSVNLVIEVVTE